MNLHENVKKIVNGSKEIISGGNQGYRLYAATTSPLGVRRNFSGGGNANVLLILVSLLAMQWKCLFTTRLPFLHDYTTKKMPHVTTTVTNNAIRWQSYPGILR